jgi:hypothetical protein
MRNPNKPVKMQYLLHVEKLKAEQGYDTPKYIQFCKLMYPYVDAVYLYESRSTVSKYVTVVRGEAQIKVRFSNHPANRMKEVIQDSDFYVGRTTKGIFNTRHAIDFVFGKLDLIVSL